MQFHPIMGPTNLNHDSSVPVRQLIAPVPLFTLSCSFPFLFTYIFYSQLYLFYSVLLSGALSHPPLHMKRYYCLNVPRDNAQEVPMFLSLLHYRLLQENGLVRVPLYCSDSTNFFTDCENCQCRGAKQLPFSNFLPIFSFMPHLINVSARRTITRPLPKW